MSSLDPLGFILGKCKVEADSVVQEPLSSLETKREQSNSKIDSPAAATKRATKRKRARSPPLSSSNCQLCHVTAKYKCPRCRFRTCSLACCQQHKKTANCNGMRSKAHYISREQYGYQEMMLDYTYLESLARVADVNNRTIRQQLTPSTTKRQFFSEQISRQARNRGIHLISMPYGMKRKLLNRTSFKSKDGLISWQIEWIFSELSSKIFLNKCKETKTLAEGLKDLLTFLPITEKRCLQAIPFEDYIFLMKKEKQPANNPKYYILNPNSTFSNSLREKTIIEFPTIFVYQQMPLDRDIEIDQREVHAEKKTESKIPNIKKASLSTNDFQIINKREHNQIKPQIEGSNQHASDNEIVSDTERISGNENDSTRENEFTSEDEIRYNSDSEFTIENESQPETTDENKILSGIGSSVENPTSSESETECDTTSDSD
ncbi:hypothetical protein G9A89_009452 [Geosiphon pyriformis]|nr:hypothetical protein G9A89_009452 [Geosiphon pyriformis]